MDLTCNICMTGSIVSCGCCSGCRRERQFCECIEARSRTLALSAVRRAVADFWVADGLNGDPAVLADRVLSAIEDLPIHQR